MPSHGEFRASGDPSHGVWGHHRVAVSDNRVPIFVENNPDMRQLRQLQVEIAHGGRGGDKGSGLTGDEDASHGDLDDVIARLNLNRICCCLLGRVSPAPDMRTA